MRKNPYSGKFIAFEGIDGSGKTTQEKMLCERMEKEGVPLLQTKEPTEDGFFGKLVRYIYMCESLHRSLPKELVRYFMTGEYQKIRSLAEGAEKRRIKQFEEIGKQIIGGNFRNLPLFLQLGMIFDRSDHRVRVEIPALGRGIHVVSDRDFLSTLAYGEGEGIAWKKLLEFHQDILGVNFIAPDCIIFLDVPPEVGLLRNQRKQGGGKEYFDTQERATKTRDSYRTILKNPRITNTIHIVEIDGTLEPETVHAIVWKYVSLLFVSD